MKKVKAFLLLTALLLTNGSCANLVQVKINVVDQRTALENQMLGSYQEIGGDLSLLASVRSIDSQGRLKPVPKLSNDRKKADALRNAQLTIKRRFPHPSFWAGFALVGDYI